jgi:NADPH2:quinone reductase
VRAAVIRDGELHVEDRPTPEPAADRVLVEVTSAGVNRADLLQLRDGHAAPPGWPKDVPGLEFSGRIVGHGDDVHSLSEGDRVFGIVGSGAQATHLVTPADQCALVPDGLDPVEAGGVPEVFMTAYDALAIRARLKAGERVLIHGVGSGVGTAALQVARSLGATTVGTARRPDKLERAEELGLDDGVVAGDDMARRIGEVDVVIDLIGGSYLETDVVVCRPGGRIVVVGLLAGASVDLDLGALFRKHLTLIGAGRLRVRPAWEKAHLTSLFSVHVAPLFTDKRLRAVIDSVVDFEQIAAAYEALGSNRIFGKVVLTMGGRP